MDSDENMCGQGNLKRKAVTGRACELLRLLHGTSCFEVMLNRRMPNGTYWWWCAMQGAQEMKGGPSAGTEQADLSNHSNAAVVKPMVVSG